MWLHGSLCGTESRSIEGIDAALRAHDLDALLFPSYYAASVPARAGYPSIIVPFGRAPERTAGPQAPTVDSPFGVMFAGTACSEPRLIELAYAFEQVSQNFASWNRTAEWLRQMDGLRQAAA